MKNALIICRKELRSYFVSPVAYILLGLYAVIMGFLFWFFLGRFVFEGMEMQMRGQMFPMSLNEYVVRPILSNVSVIGLFLIPLITMRLFAEEKRTGTIELLVTSPVRDFDIVFGKWMAGFGFYICMLLLGALNFIFLFKYGNPDWKPMLVQYLGLFLQAGAMVALGTFISTLTKNQIVAAALTFAACLMLLLFGWLTAFETTTWANVLSYLSIFTHMESFERGVIDSKDAIYYVTVIFLGLFFTARSMESLRWRS
jgi:ABC-2 type transport system permease protein